jgi:hypothetical protein
MVEPFFNCPKHWKCVRSHATPVPKILRKCLSFQCERFLQGVSRNHHRCPQAVALRSYREWRILIFRNFPPVSLLNTVPTTCPTLLRSPATQRTCIGKGRYWIVFAGLAVIILFLPLRCLGAVANRRQERNPTCSLTTI